MGKHYLPQYYLQGFTASPDTPLLWAYEKGSSVKFLAPVVTLANEKRYWSNEIESWLAHDIESPANHVLQKIRQRQKLTLEDKASLSVYIVTMQRRVPQGRAQTVRWLSDRNNTDPIFHQLYASLEQEESLHPESSELVRKAKVQLEHAQNDLPSTSDVRTVWEKTLYPMWTARSILAVATMSWGFLIHDRGPAFITCDNPVFYFRDEGVGRPKAELSFPIDKHTVLWAARRCDWRENYVSASKSLIHEMNRRSASFATRYAFYATEENWISRLINRKVLRVTKYL